MNEQELIKEAFLAMKKSYSPYSKFPIGAAILCKDGTVYRGTNIENASYSLSMCAERIALYTAFSDGKTKDDIKAIAIAANSKSIATCCGACRQVISELCNKDVNIYFVNKRGQKLKMKVKDLLPHGFSKEDLAK